MLHNKAKKKTKRDVNFFLYLHATKLLDEIEECEKKVVEKQESLRKNKSELK